MRFARVTTAVLVLVGGLTAAAPMVAAASSEPSGKAVGHARRAPTTTTTTVATTTMATTAAAGPVEVTAPAEADPLPEKSNTVKAAKVRAAAASLTITTITWDVIGLDSNDVTVGPNVYPVGVRVCAVGGAVADITVTFAWDTANAYVQLLTSATQSIASLADGACADRYFFVAVVRDAAAYDTTRDYHITASAPGVATVSTPTPRQLYVERILSQNRNSVLSISGPTTVYEGDTVTYTVEASTAPNGYSQLDTYLTMLGPLFDLLGVDVDYETPAGTTTSSPYADACGWDPNPLNGTYRTCIGPATVVGGKVGGSITGTYTGTVIGTGSTSLTTAIIDVSGASYHYNTDFGTDPNLLFVVALPSADLALAKAAVGAFTAGGTGTYTLTVSNQGPSASLVPTTVTDTLPEGMSFVSAEGSGWQCSAAGRVVTCTSNTVLARSASSTVTLRVALDPSLAGQQVNTAVVSGPARDLDQADNTASAAVDIVSSAADRTGDAARASRSDAAAGSGNVAGTGLPATGGDTVLLILLAGLLLGVGTALRRVSARRPYDAGYTAYDAHPLDEPDQWGDLSSWRQAAGAS
jgi:uncharacterized repeat protein (TIGR01451 family)